MITEGFFYFSLKPYVVTPQLNRLVETVQMRGQNICFYVEFTKIIPYYRQTFSLISSSDDDIMHGKEHSN